MGSFWVVGVFGAPPNQKELQALSNASDMVEATNALRERLMYDNRDLDAQVSMLDWFCNPLSPDDQTVPGTSHTDYPISYCVSAGCQHLVNLLLSILVDLLCVRGEISNIGVVLSQSCFGCPPLLRALRRGDFQVAIHLIEAGAVSGMTEQNVCLVINFVALAQGRVRNGLILSLVSRGVNPNIRDSTGSTLVHLAAETGDVSTVSFLVVRGGSIAELDAQEREPVDIAAAYDYRAVVNYLLLQAAASFGVTYHNMQRVLDHATASEAQLRCRLIRRLVSRGVHPNTRNSDGSTLVHLAVDAGDEPTVRFLVEQGGSIVELDADGREPIHIAAARGYLDIIEFLLRISPERINAFDFRNLEYTPLHEAAFAGQAGVVVHLLLQHQAGTEGITEDGETPLHLAVSQGHAEVVAVLLAFGAERTAVNNEGQTPVHLAVIAQDSDIVDLLLLHPLEPVTLSLLTIDDFGRQPVHIAALTGNLSIVQRLLEVLPESLNSGDGENEFFTPLHEAAYERQSHVVEYLVGQAGINIDSLTDSDETPLHLAVENGDRSSVITLINAGASTELEDSSGRTPYAVALANGYLAVADILNERASTGPFDSIMTNEWLPAESDIDQQDNDTQACCLSHSH